MNKLEEGFYTIAANEIAMKCMVPGVYSKAFSDAEGDEKKAISIYIKLRVDQMHVQLKADELKKLKTSLENFESLIGEHFFWLIPVGFILVLFLFF